jgi:hypothetical protein
VNAQPAPAAADRAPASDLIATLREKAPRAAMTLAAAQLAWPATARVRSWARDRSTYTVKVHGTDGIYDDLHEWVLSLLAPKEQRALVAWSTRRGMLMEAPVSGRASEPPPPPLRLRYDGTREQAIAVGGHKIRVVVAEHASSDEERWKPPEIVFTARSAAARSALLREIEGVLRRSRQSERKPSFRMLDKWGDWEKLDDLPPRTLDSVILPDGQLERLTADVARFLAAEQDYVRRCVPWHRGYLFEGPPGTGKTSVARAIASHFGMDVWYLPLADVRKDAELLRVATRIGPRSMLLLEDADVFHAATKRDDDSPDKVTLSGLLNTLDGIATPHGLLTVLTTNRPGALDDAVTRAGRIDLTEHFGLADARQVEQLIRRWYERGAIGPGGIPEISGIAPADVIEACKRHDDPAHAIGQLLTLEPQP